MKHHNWKVLSLPRSLPLTYDRIASRKVLGISSDAFLVCSFGFMADTKMIDSICNAWFASDLSKNASCQLIFVGANDGGHYGKKILELINDNPCDGKISITDWVDSKRYKNFLQAADVSIQLRQKSRGEMSASVLDCLCYGLPTIVNAHGPLSELPSEVTMCLPNKFKNDELVNAIETLWSSTKKREALTRASKEYIKVQAALSKSEKQYIHEIENIYKNSNIGLNNLLKILVGSLGFPNTQKNNKSLAKAVSYVTPKNVVGRQLLVDISTIMNDNLKTGIERAVKSRIIRVA